MLVGSYSVKYLWIIHYYYYYYYYHYYQGDSGGSLVTGSNTSPGHFIQSGIVSWGFNCAEPDFPGVYARVSSKCFSASLGFELQFVNKIIFCKWLN